jgi:NADH-quinone oxidoreductase subunit A
MTYPYFPIFVFILVGFLLGIAAFTIGKLLSPSRPYPAKQAAYECGFEPFETAHLPFDIRYYRIAILFIIFDLETVFLFPWAVSLRQIGLPGFWAMAGFLGILLIGFVYEWKKGALEWV